MKLNVKEYFKLAIIYTVIAALPPMLQLITQPFIVGKGRLNAVDFSYLAITEIITTFVFVVTAYSMGVAISRFYYDHIEDKKGYNKLVSGVFNSIIIRGIGLLLLAVVFGKYIGQFFSQKELKDFPDHTVMHQSYWVSAGPYVLQHLDYTGMKKRSENSLYSMLL